MNQKHTISVYVSNKPGVLVRVAEVFSRRGYNIDSLVVSPGLEGDYSRMTITAQGDKETLEQIIAQVSKLVDVLRATEHSNQVVLEKELVLIKVSIDTNNRTEILQIIDHFKGLTVDFTEQSLIVQATGSTEKIDHLLEMLKKYGIKELVRSGKILMARGEEIT